MKISFGGVEIQLDPDHSAKEVADAKRDVESWRSIHERQTEGMERLQSMIYNAHRRKPVGDTVSGVANLPADHFETLLREVASRYEESLRQYAELRRLVHPNIGASHERVVQEMSAREAARRASRKKG